MYCENVFREPYAWAEKQEASLIKRDVFIILDRIKSLSTLWCNAGSFPPPFTMEQVSDNTRLELEKVLKQVVFKHKVSIKLEQRRYLSR